MDLPFIRSPEIKGIMWLFENTLKIHEYPEIENVIR